MFTERERAVYAPPGADAAFDPLAVLRTITVRSGGRTLKQLIDAFNAGLPADDGPTDQPRTPEEAVAAAVAEGHMAAAGRAAFGLQPFPDGPTDAVVLGMVFDFAAWLEKND